MNSTCALIKYRRLDQTSISHSLDFKGLNVTLNNNLMVVNPMWNCHFCGHVGEGSTSFNVNVNKYININRLVTFQLPCCGNSVELYVAVYKPKLETNIRVCVQRSDAEGAGVIPVDWYLMEATA